MKIWYKRATPACFEIDMAQILKPQNRLSCKRRYWKVHEIIEVFDIICVK